MRFMILVKATADSEAGALPDESLLNAMADYHGELARAGVLVDANGLHPTSKGWRIEWSDGRKIVTDGPFAETKELIAGYTIINVASREEAIEWAGRFPNPALGDGAIEVRQIFELEDFGDIPGIERFRELEAADSNK
jgi:hypothetical protein